MCWPTKLTAAPGHKPEARARLPRSRFGLVSASPTRLTCLVVGLAVGLLCLPAAARAILIQTGGTLVGGYFVREDGNKLTVRVRTPDGRETVNEYDRAK